MGQTFDRHEEASQQKDSRSQFLLQLAQHRHRSSHPLVSITMTSRLVGMYRREPSESPDHQVKVEEDGEGSLIWKPDGSDGWPMTLSKDDDTLLLFGDKCPKDCKQVTVELEEDRVVGLRFNGDLYERKDFVFEMPDDVSDFQDDSDSDGAVVQDDATGFDTDDDDGSTDGV